eukprot:7613650-Karenia_brevis.AAC.1
MNGVPHAQKGLVESASRLVHPPHFLAWKVNHATKWLPCGCRRVLPRMGHPLSLICVLPFPFRCA